jgi:Ca2+-transporting ATPase
MAILVPMSTAPDTDDRPWFALDGDAVADELGVAADQGLTTDEVAPRRDHYGPNALPAEPTPSVWSIAWTQLVNPMTLMLVGVVIVGLFADQLATVVIVGLLVTLNVVRGTSQELKARASVDALAELQVPTARVRRDGSTVELDAVELVPGDIVFLEAGDLAPADGRLLVSATLEMQESALTGESAPVPKAADRIDDPETPLGDRSNMVFQNTLATRGTATFVVTATGTTTEMGRIAGMVTDIQRRRSALQIELDRLSKLLGMLAGGAVIVIVAVGLARGLDLDDVLVLAIATAIASIPTGLPTFVQTMLSSGARRLAEHRAVVKTLADVETLGGTTAINSDKTGTLTLNAMTAVSMMAGGRWYRIQGEGYATTGGILHEADDQAPDFRRLGLGLALCSDATVADDGTIVGDPTEAALVVLARSSHAHWHGEVVPIDQVRDEIAAANQRLSEQGLRVLSFAARGLDEAEMTAAIDDPMAAVGALTFISLVGIIDPLRPSAKDAVRIAHGAGIDVRMITGDHTVTARAIGDELGLGPGVINGTDLAHLADGDVVERLPELHVFGRVAPEDKVRLARLMQEAGEVVAMTGDAVNDAAALKQADVGVAMGSGSEVTKQAGKIVLTDDNFATLVHAVELGRDIYRRISSYIRLQLTILSSVLQLMLLATVFNINGGVALFPMQLLFAKFFVVATVVVGFIVDVPDPGVMQRPPRRPGSKIADRAQAIRWVVSGFLLAGPALAVLQWGPDEPDADVGTTAMTMAFAIVALGAVNNGLVLRREREPWWSAPLFPYLGWVMLGWGLTWMAVELGMMQRLLDTVSLSGGQWLVVLALSLVSPAFVAVDKVLQLRRQHD